MPQSSPTIPPKQRDWVALVALQRPDAILIAPIMVYLLLLGLKDLLPPNLNWLAAIIRGAGGAAAVWIVRKHLPPWGRAHCGLAAVCGLLAAAGWFYGQYFFNWLGVPHVLPIGLFGRFVPTDPRVELGSGGLLWATLVLKIAVATVTVPLVEELFWRAFLLRALIDWHDFERVPLGKPSARASLLTALLSTIQHPYNWLVSIPCWLLFNGLMYWKKSVLFLVLVHGFTNLFLYTWVLLRVFVWDDATAWMFW